MDIELFNTLSRQKERFLPIHEGKVGIYTCGPTVYQRASIGNFRAYVFSDILRRMFEVNGYEVSHIMNITDVGHLTDDASEGEDKVEKASENMLYTVCEQCQESIPTYISTPRGSSFETLTLEENISICPKCGHKQIFFKKDNRSNVYYYEESVKKVSAWDIASLYTEFFQKDMACLNIKTPMKMPRATDHIEEQIAFIEDIEKAGFAYTISDGVYFDTSKLSHYGELAMQKLEEKEEGARVMKNPEKRNPTDFALWKFSRPEEHRQMEWKSPWGIGFPGWHIECSAMSEKYLDVPFDIHTGGIDHITVHHTNEIAQTEAARGINPAHYWMHNAFLLIDGGKMSKSLGNTYSLDDLKEKGFEPLSLRYFYLGAHYRVQQNFTWEALGAAQNALHKLYESMRGCKEGGTPSETHIEDFMSAVNNDLDMPKALAMVWAVVDDKNLSADKKGATLIAFDAILGLSLEDYLGKKLEIPSQVQELVEKREFARQEKDFSRSDSLRKEIGDLGYLVEDTAQGPVVHKAEA